MFSSFSLKKWGLDISIFRTPCLAEGALKSFCLIFHFPAEYFASDFKTGERGLSLFFRAPNIRNGPRALEMRTRYPRTLCTEARVSLRCGQYNLGSD